MPPRKPAQKKAPAAKKGRHVCVKNETIERHNVLLTRLGLVTLGNGDPENGLLFMFRSFLEKDKQNDKSIQRIDESLKGINSNYNILFTEIIAVGTELNNLKSRLEGERDAKAKADEEKQAEENKKVTKESFRLTKSRDTWYKILTIIALGVSIWLGLRVDKKNDKVIATTEETKNEVKNQGVPFVVNSRGEFFTFSDTAYIKKWPNDSLRYAIIQWQNDTLTYKVMQDTQWNQEKQSGLK